MKAITTTGWGLSAKLTLETASAPARLGANDVLVQVHAASVYPKDWKLNYHAAVAFTPLLVNKLAPFFGDDLAGVIIDKGSKVRDFEIGDAVCDPAGAAGEGAINYKSWRQDFQKGLGHKVRKARVPKNALEPRLKSVRGWLNRSIGQERTLKVHRRCTMIRRAFRTKYYFKRVGKGSGEGFYNDVPAKVQGYADLMDALQYGCFELDKGLGLTGAAERRLGMGHNGGPRMKVDSDFDVFSTGG